VNTVTVTRTAPGTPTDVRAAMDERESFARAAGFDEVVVDGETIRVANDVGVAEIALKLAVVDDADAALAVEARSGIFAEMQTTYALRSAPDETEVTATTEFALDLALVGGLLDATVVARQRKRELRAQLDYLADAVEARPSRRDYRFGDVATTASGPCRSTASPSGSNASTSARIS